MTAPPPQYDHDLVEEPYSGLFGAPHTMAQLSLERYVTATKFSDEQKSLLDAAIASAWPIKVQGIYVEHLPSVLASRRMTEIKRAIRKPTRQKQFNCHRPAFIQVKDEFDNNQLLVCAFPSREYVQQITALIYYYYGMRTTNDGQEFQVPAGRIQAVHYPRIESTLADWTGLRGTANSVMRAGDVAIMGHVEELSHYLSSFQIPEVARVSIEPDGYGEIAIHELPGFDVRIALIGITHSYWGSAAGLIAKTLAEAGASEIFYVAKAGTLIGDGTIHGLVSPQHYYTLEKPIRGGESHWSWRQHEVKSGLHALAPELVNRIKVGVHLTVPTVVGETLRQHERYKALRPATIDNEIGYIARSIEEINKTRTKDEAIQFSCLHFVTDFLNPQRDRNVEVAPTSFDLATTGKSAKEIVAKKRDEAFEHAAEILVAYLKQVGARRKDRSLTTSNGPRDLPTRALFIEEAYKTLARTKSFRTIVAGPFFVHPEWYFERKRGRNAYPDFDALLSERVRSSIKTESRTKLIITNSDRYVAKILNYLSVDEVDRLAADSMVIAQYLFQKSEERGLDICCAPVGHTHIPYIYDDAALFQFRVNPMTPTGGGYLHSDPRLVRLEAEKFDQILAGNSKGNGAEFRKLLSIFAELPLRARRWRTGINHE